jgi:hypothetical protein
MVYTFGEGTVLGFPVQPRSVKPAGSARLTSAAPARQAEADRKLRMRG